MARPYANENTKGWASVTDKIIQSESSKTQKGKEMGRELHAKERVYGKYKWKLTNNTMIKVSWYF